MVAAGNPLNKLSQSSHEPHCKERMGEVFRQYPHSMLGAYLYLMIDYFTDKNFDCVQHILPEHNCW